MSTEQAVPGSTEPVPTAPETQNQAPEAEQATEATADAAESEQDEGKSAEKPELTPEQKRIRDLERARRKDDRIKAKLYAEAEVLRAELGKRQQSPTDDGQPGDGKSAPDPMEVARQILDAERFTARCNDIAEQGKKQFKGAFEESLRTVVQEIGPLFDARGRPTALMEAVADLDAPAAVLHHIGSNPDLAEELADLTGRRLDRKLALIERELAEAKTAPRSAAPKPVEAPKGGAPRGEPDPDKDPAAWIAWRNKQVGR